MHHVYNFTVTINSNLTEWENGTYADFESLNCVVQQQYVAHNLCVLPVSLQLRRPDIVGSASRQAEARAHHAPTRVCNNQQRRENDERERKKKRWNLDR